MTPLLEMLALYAPPVILLAPLGALAFVLWRRGFATDNPLPLAEMLAHHRVAASGVFTPGAARELAGAARRCATCGATKACREWLDSDRRDGYEEFCVNAPFIERLKR